MAKPSTPTAAKKKPGKAEKIRLTKQQKIRVGQMIRIENRISVCRQYIKLWAQLFRFFADHNPERKVTAEEEKNFFQVITALARKHFLFNELMGDTFSSPDKILELLTEMTSLQKLVSLDEVAISKLELEWHGLFLEMNVALGRLLRQMPGSMTIDEMLTHSESIAQEVQAQHEASSQAPAPEGEAEPAPAKSRGFFRRKK